jgi:hypothetical protein
MGNSRRRDTSCSDAEGVSAEYVKLDLPSARPNNWPGWKTPAIVGTTTGVPVSRPSQARGRGQSPKLRHYGGTHPSDKLAHLDAASCEDGARSYGH